MTPTDPNAHESYVRSLRVVDFKEKLIRFQTRLALAINARMDNSPKASASINQSTTSKPLHSPLDQASLPLDKANMSFKHLST